MKIPIDCPFCHHNFIHNVHYMNVVCYCSYSINHYARFNYSLNYELINFEMSLSSFNKRYSCTIGEGAIIYYSDVIYFSKKDIKCIMIPYFEHDFFDINKLIAKIETYATFS